MFKLFNVNIVSINFGEVSENKSAWNHGRSSLSVVRFIFLSTEAAGLATDCDRFH